MTRTATVITDSLNLRSGPDTSFAIVGKLTEGATVQLTGRSGVWRRVLATAGPGWVHGDFIAVTGRVPVSSEPDPPEPEVDAGGEPAVAATTVPATYTVAGGDTLGKIGERFGVDWRAIATLNALANPDVLAVGQVLKLPGGTAEASGTGSGGTQRGGEQTGTGTATPASYTVAGGDTLGTIAAKFGVDWREIASLNQLANPDILVPGQALRIPGGTGQLPGTQTGGTAPAGTLVLGNPFRTTLTAVTSSGTERPPHHTPFGGNLACDLDVMGIDSRGVPVFFEAEATGVEVRGVVDTVAPTCRSRVIADGGWYVRLRLQKRVADGAWQDCNAWVLYGHLDPIDVALGQVVAPGTQVGRLGPPPPSPEYRSSCASASHTHIEVTRGTWVENKGVQLNAGQIMRISV